MSSSMRLPVASNDPSELLNEKLLGSDGLTHELTRPNVLCVLTETPVTLTLPATSTWPTPKSDGEPVADRLTMATVGNFVAEESEE